MLGREFESRCRHTNWDFSSQMKIKNKNKKVLNKWRTISSSVHKIWLHGRRGKGTAESFSREKSRQAPQKEGGREILCDPGWYVQRTWCPEWMERKHTHTHCHTPSGQSRVYQVTHLLTDGVHRREPAGVLPIQETRWTNYCAPLFSYTLYTINSINTINTINTIKSSSAIISTYGTFSRVRGVWVWRMGRTSAQMATVGTCIL